MYMRFSERMGYVKPRLEMQIESMDEGLSNRLWAVTRELLDIELEGYNGLFTTFGDSLYKTICIHYLKMSYSYVWECGDSPIELMNEHYENSEWNFKYELIEEIIRHFPKFRHDFYVIWKEFSDDINTVLEEESAGYRLINDEFVPITDEIQLEEINIATESTNAAGKHIENGIANLSDKTNPDYRTAIKESIDAVESICKQITKESADMNAKTTLGTALKELKKHGFDVHSALIDGWSKIYGYASDGGIRHDLEAGASFDQEDAIYFLSTCAAFVNYLKVKADKHGINLE